jgi:dephospho-CoA kinase
MIIGITGIFGSGKTIVSRLFAKHGYKVVNADEIGHRLLNKRPIKDKVIKVFGKSILVNNRINRRKLKDIVFNNHRKLIKLNKIIHPPIIKEIKSIIKKSKNKKIVIDAALLIEVKALSLVDKLIVVKINKKEQLKRVLKKKKYNKKEIRNIIKSQLSQKEKLKYGDYIVDNSGSLNNTKKQVNRICELI